MVDPKLTKLREDYGVEVADLAWKISSLWLSEDEYISEQGKELLESLIPSEDDIKKIRVLVDSISSEYSLEERLKAVPSTLEEHWEEASALLSALRQLWREQHDEMHMTSPAWTLDTSRVRRYYYALRTAKVQIDFIIFNRAPWLQTVSIDDVSGVTSLELELQPFNSCVGWLQRKLMYEHEFKQRLSKISVDTLPISFKWSTPLGDHILEEEKLTKRTHHHFEVNKLLPDQPWPRRRVDSLKWEW